LGVQAWEACRNCRCLLQQTRHGHGCHVSRSLPTRFVFSFTRSLTISVISHEHWRHPSRSKDWSLTTLKEKLIKIGAKVVSHGRYVAFQMAEVAISQHLFAHILRLIAELRPPPDLAPA
jgi:hypothetical protein